MKCMYNVAIWFYCLAVRIVAMFNQKVRLMRQGERDAYAKIKSELREGDKVVWVHAASLGEFEQGRPLIEKLKKSHPDYKILLTFFSPSGYEVRKNYAGADVICYLPLDTKANARRFVELVKPEMAVFVKYEFWLNYLSELRRKGVATYIISAIFRQDQVFFKRYGGLFREALKTFNILFVQNDESKELLKGIGVENVVVAGDTRFDRVADIAAMAKKLAIVEEFVAKKEEKIEIDIRAEHRPQPVLVVGSSWSPDEELLVRYVNERAGKMKMIIAPHEVREERIKELTSKLTCKYVLYTEITDKSQSLLAECDVLVINTIGLLSSIYQYGQAAYIGGGFGVGIHNTLEAAAWGIPVVFGPNYHKFQEAKELIDCGAGKSINSYEECAAALDEFLLNGAAASQAAAVYVASHTGATDLIYNTLIIDK